MNISKRLKHKLAKHNLLQQAIKTVKKDGYLELVIDSCEKWNNGPSGLVETPKEDGSFDVEGHSCCDVRVRVFTPFLSFGYWKNSVWGWLKDVTASRRWSEFKINLQYHPFTKYFDGWLWVIDSFYVAKSQYAEEIIDLTRPELLVTPGNYQKRNDETEKVTATITDKQLEDHLKITGAQLSQSFFVTDSDPTCMVVNEKCIKYVFNLKDGWSNKQIERLIRDWWRYTELPWTVFEMRKSKGAN